MEASNGYPRPGTVIASKYRVERVLGVGGMGSVLAAEHLLLKQRVALKFVHDANDREATDRFLREARAAALLESEHVCRVMDVGLTEEGVPYIVMEMLAGMDLAARLVAFGPQSVEDAVGFILQVLDGLAEAHARGIVHRDLKPSNLFLANRGDGTTLVKVLDFGISKLQHVPDVATAPTGAHEAPPPSSRRAPLTATGVTMGSPPYMSPEQLQSSRDVDARCDLWAVGAILYELLTAKRAFPPSSDLFVRILSGEHTPPRSLRPDLPEALEAIIERCLLVDPKRRWASAGELANALAPFAPARARAHVERAARWSKGPPPVEPMLAATTVVSSAPSPTGGVELAATRPIDSTKSRRLVSVASGLVVGLVIAVAAIAVRGWTAKSKPAASIEAMPTPVPVEPVMSVTPPPTGTVIAPPPTASNVPNAATAAVTEDAGSKTPAARTRGRARPSGAGDVDLGRL